MPRVIHGRPPDVIQKQASWLIEIRKKWSDAWKVAGGLIPLRCERHALSVGPAYAQLLGRYGPSMKQTYESRMGTWNAPDFDLIRGTWVKISLLAAGGGRKVIFVGRVEREDAAPQGDMHGAQGDKIYGCYGPELLLETDIYQSAWDRDGTTQLLDRMPDFNQRDQAKDFLRDRKRGLGNKATRRDADSALFGGTGLFNHYEALEELLKRWVQVSGGPKWRIGGATEYLKTLTADIRRGDVETAGDLMRRIIDPRWGLDAFIRYYRTTVAGGGTEDGFEIIVYALLGESTAFGGFDYPLNANRVSVSASHDVNLIGSQIERDGAQLYDRIVVAGAPSISVFTLNASASGGLDEQLYGKWAAADENRYKDPLLDRPSASKAERDAARQSDEYRNVFQLFGASDAAFSWNNMSAVPYIDGNGNFVAGEKYPVGRDYQRAVRNTLSWIPLREGWDYSGATPSGPASDDPKWRPPFALVKARAKLDSGATKDVYVFVDQLNAVMPNTPPASVEPLEHDWGVRLRSTPNHVFARGQGMPAGKSQFEADTDGVDWHSLIVTIAAQTDHRLVLVQDLPTALQSGLGRVKVIDAPELQFWFLAPRTVWGHDANGALLRGPGTGTVLRNDRDNGARIMAGAIARYLRERVRATLLYKELNTWDVFLGSILETRENGVPLDIGSPISSVQWDFGERTTRVMTGGAIQTSQARQRQVLAAARPHDPRGKQQLPGDRPAAAKRRETTPQRSGAAT